MDIPERRPLHHYWQPRYWPAWVGIAVLRLTCFLPYRWQIELGKAIGRLAHRVAAERRAITRRNIELCFATPSAAQSATTAETSSVLAGRTRIDDWP